MCCVALCVPVNMGNVCVHKTNKPAHLLMGDVCITSPRGHCVGGGSNYCVCMCVYIGGWTPQKTLYEQDVKAHDLLYLRFKYFSFMDIDPRVSPYSLV